MIAVLQGIIHHGEDQILIVDLGQTEAMQIRVESIGRPVPKERRESRVF
jgi:hypothetical protein